MKNLLARLVISHLFILGACFTTTAALADYKVEVLLFLNNGDDRYKETPINLPVAPTFADIVSANAAQLPAGYTVTPESEYKLKSQYKRLERSERYTPLFHTGWRQPEVLERDEQAIRINGKSANGIIVDGSLSVFLETDGTLMINSNIYALERTDAGLSSDTVNSLLGEVSADNEANAEANNSASSNANVTANAWNAWRTKERRDISNINRVQYFDNPAFGLLVRIRRIDTGPSPVELMAQQRAEAEAAKLAEEQAKLEAEAETAAQTENQGMTSQDDATTEDATDASSTSGNSDAATEAQTEAQTGAQAATEPEATDSNNEVVGPPASLAEPPPVTNLTLPTPTVEVVTEGDVNIEANAENNEPDTATEINSETNGSITAE